MVFFFQIPDVAPIFSKPPADTTVTEGMTAVLRCDVLGAPKPAIAWKKGNKLIILLRNHFNYCCLPGGISIGLASSCSASQKNEPILTFCISGKQILASGSVQIPRFLLLESGGLQITPVSLQDAGNYTCCAVNAEGTLNASASLTVWSKYLVCFTL